MSRRVHPDSHIFESHPLFRTSCPFTDYKNPDYAEQWLFTHTQYVTAYLRLDTKTHITQMYAQLSTFRHATPKTIQPNCSLRFTHTYSFSLFDCPLHLRTIFRVGHSCIQPSYFKYLFCLQCFYSATFYLKHLFISFHPFVASPCIVWSAIRCQWPLRRADQMITRKIRCTWQYIIVTIPFLLWREPHDILHVGSQIVLPFFFNKFGGFDEDLPACILICQIIDFIDVALVK